MVYIEIFRSDKRTFVNWPNKNAEKQRNVNLINRNTYEQKKNGARPIGTETIYDL